jgi:hypothetical protein
MLTDQGVKKAFRINAEKQKRKWITNLETKPAVVSHYLQMLPSRVYGTYAIRHSGELRLHVNTYRK